VISRSDPQRQKQFEQKTSTEFGIQIDESDEQSLKTSDSSRQSFDCDSNVISRRDVHDEKQFLQRISTEFGIQIDERDRHFENTRFENVKASTNSFPLSPSSTTVDLGRTSFLPPSIWQ
jgi:hypothetical protein